METHYFKIPFHVEPCQRLLEKLSNYEANAEPALGRGMGSSLAIVFP